MRYAVYLTPPANAPLALAADAWLGRSAFGGAARSPEAPAEAKAHIPARYGFHGTMRSPFRLREGATEGALIAAFDAFVAHEAPIPAKLNVAQLSRFIALVAPDQDVIAAAAIRALAAFEPLRAPLSASDRARRRPDQLDIRGLELLNTWGYPLVEERFTFHMTLSGPLEGGHVDPVMVRARSHFAQTISEPADLVFALFREDEEGGPFHVIAAAPHNRAEMRSTP
ncbi:MAG: DUF1045 domain-containing protein [Pseudomonadota bacterium]